MSQQRNERLDRTNDLLEKLIEQMSREKETNPTPLNQQAPPPEFTRHTPPAPPAYSNKAPPVQGQAQVVTYLEFLNYKPAHFRGTTKYTEAEEWLRSIETTFYMIHKPIPEEDKVRFATAMLKDDARIWWDTFRIK